MIPLIDYFLPDYQFREYHARTIRCRPEDVLAAVLDCDLGRSALVRALFRLRGLPTGRITLETMEKVGFRVLGKQLNREVVIGLIGRFWTLSGGIHPFAPEQFVSTDRPDLVKAAINFRVQAHSRAFTRLTTETRVWCPTAGSRRRFRLYWFLIRPFSGLVRIEWLRLVQQQVETVRLLRRP
jgi:hypothetical protein